MAFPFLGLFLIFVLVLAYFRKKGTEAQKQVEASFWEREQKANHVRRQDISGLPYITIPFEKFPIGISNEEDLIDYENELKELSKLTILNLTGQTNTDLKLKYGPANLTELSEYDQNFTKLARTLVAYARCLISHGYELSAKPVLEFGVECGSDVSANYILLAEIYKKQGETDQLNRLIEKAEGLDSLMKASILSKLAEISDDSASSHTEQSADQ